MWCRTTGIGKGYEYAGDQVVAVTGEELRKLPLPTAEATGIEGALAPMEMTGHDDRDDLSGPEFHDSCTEALSKIIEAKREHTTPPGTRGAAAGPGPGPDGRTPQPVSEAKAARSEEDDDATAAAQCMNPGHSSGTEHNRGA